MNKLPTKQSYLLIIIIVGIIALSIYSTYAIFTFEGSTSDIVSLYTPNSLKINVSKNLPFKKLLCRVSGLSTPHKYAAKPVSKKYILGLFTTLFTIDSSLYGSTRYIIPVFTLKIF